MYTQECIPRGSIVCELVHFGAEMTKQIFGGIKLQLNSDLDGSRGEIASK